MIENIDNSLIDRIEGGVAPADVDPFVGNPNTDEKAPGAEPTETDPTRETAQKTRFEAPGGD